MLEHGGRLRRAAQRYGIAPREWLDLSTGISPWSWLDHRALQLPPACWSRLPEDKDGLAAAARDYYGADALPVAGSQAAIQALPRLRPRCRVGVLAPSYAEHALHWQRAGHEVVVLTPAQCADATATLDVLLLVQPDNPSGHRFARADLLAWHTRLATRGGWLLVDEAFADAQPQSSLAAESARPGLVVLRSLGKFFGLAGARVGFVLAAAPIRIALQEALGPWSVAGPSRHVATLALRDRNWQLEQRVRLLVAGERLTALLRAAGLEPDGGCELFQWRQTPHAVEIHEALARRGILTRLFETPSSLRFGLPRSEQDWQRLEAALVSPLPRAGEGPGERAGAAGTHGVCP